MYFEIILNNLISISNKFEQLSKQKVVLVKINVKYTADCGDKTVAT